MGNAQIAPSCQRVQAVHPHGCGERCFNVKRQYNIAGSSPRLWGTLRVKVIFNRQRRFIPTAVGNAQIAPSCQRVQAVHPHGCGERCFNVKRQYNIAGSSPRLWGTLRVKVIFNRQRRFIPTAVGNAQIAPSCQRVQAVHPHGCGERYLRFVVIVVICGSSPRLWGTLETGVATPKLRRFIPTAVGNAGVLWLIFITGSVHPHGCGERASASCMVKIIRRFIPTAVGNAA